MKIRPILFNTQMVRAIREDRKTATRRLILQEKVQKILQSPCRIEHPDIPDENFIKLLCDGMYEKGNVLWVRETWSFWPCYDCDNEMCYGGKDWYKDIDGCFVYKTQENKVPYEEKWRPSIHMPKEAARIFLRVTDVRAERLQDMTVEDAKKEGAFHACGFCIHWSGRCARQIALARDCPIDRIAPEFPRLWDSTIPRDKLDTCGFDANPWVCAIEFERCEKPKEF